MADVIERDVEGTFTAVRFFRALTAAAVRTTCEFSVSGLDSLVTRTVISYVF